MSRRKKYTIEEVQDVCSQKNGKCLSKTYLNNKAPLLFSCNKCSHCWTTNFKAIVVDNQWCPKCAGRLNNNIDTVRQLAISRNGVCLSTVYKGNKKNLEWQCNVCKNIWKARLDRVKNGTWCPKCRRSWGERAISKYLDYIGIKYIEEHNIINNNYRFDFLIPSYNLAIEYDGIQHFKIHRRYAPDLKTLKRTQERDINKVLFCIKNNINLLRISYTDFYRLENVIEYVLKNKESLVMSDMTLYDYIISKIPKNISVTTLL